MPADSDLTLPHTFRPFGVRLAIFVLGALLLLVVLVMWFSFPQEIRDQFTAFQVLTVVVLGAMFYAGGFALARSRLVARSYVMMDYDIRTERVEEAVALTPGIESPTVSPLHREGWVAVRSMVPRDTAQRVMDELWDLGARGILSTDIHACRL
jgi:ATP phosphoribosyltransferase-like protein